MRPPARILRVLPVVLLAALAVPSVPILAAGAAAPRKAPPAVAPAWHDALTRALGAGRIDEAQYALERVASVFDPASVRARFGDVRRPDPRDATILLRDLMLRVQDLSGADRARARIYLARPTKPSDDDAYSVNEETPVCSTDVCIHYVATTGDAPPNEDTSPANGIPDAVDATGAVMDDVWTFVVDTLGYRAPKSDTNSQDDGGNGKLDVYLANIGGKGLYGYCTSDDPNQKPSSGYNFYDLSAYCVLDDDYAEFGYPDPMDPLTVTAVHEFFHAVQFAYDAYEDPWIMEASSTWIEDELYDAVDDNLQYLAQSPLAQPLVPVDKNTSPRWYGAWIFIRFLSEYVGANDGGATGPDPSIVRSIWTKLDGSPGGPDLYSTQAVASAIAARTLNGSKGKIRWVFADFGLWNSVPKKFYSEGASYGPADIAESKALTGSNHTFASTDPIDHLSNRFVSLKRGSGIAGDAKLKIRIDGPDTVSSPEASAVVVKKTGAVSAKAIVLDSAGRGSLKVAFDSTVARVIVIATNGSVRYTNCWTGATLYACYGGNPVDENRSFTVRAAVV
jgi:hypothetical protein